MHNICISTPTKFSINLEVPIHCLVRHVKEKYSIMVKIHTDYFQLSLKPETNIPIDENLEIVQLMTGNLYLYYEFPLDEILQKEITRFNQQIPIDFYPEVDYQALRNRIFYLSRFTDIQTASLALYYASWRIIIANDLIKLNLLDKFIHSTEQIQEILNLIPNYEQIVEDYENNKDKMQDQVQNTENSNSDIPRDISDNEISSHSSPHDETPVNVVENITNPPSLSQNHLVIQNIEKTLKEAQVYAQTQAEFVNEINTETHETTDNEKQDNDSEYQNLPNISNVHIEQNDIIPPNTAEETSEMHENTENQIETEIPNVSSINIEPDDVVQPIAVEETDENAENNNTSIGTENSNVSGINIEPNDIIQPVTAEEASEIIENAEQNIESNTESISNATSTFIESNDVIQTITTEEKSEINENGENQINSIAEDIPSISSIPIEQNDILQPIITDEASENSENHEKLNETENKNVLDIQLEHYDIVQPIIAEETSEINENTEQIVDSEVSNISSIPIESHDMIKSIPAAEEPEINENEENNIISNETEVSNVSSILIEQNGIEQPITTEEASEISENSENHINSTETDISDIPMEHNDITQPIEVEDESETIENTNHDIESTAEGIPNVSDTHMESEDTIEPETTESSQHEVDNNTSYSDVQEIVSPKVQHRQSHHEYINLHYFKNAEYEIEFAEDLPDPEEDKSDVIETQPKESSNTSDSSDKSSENPNDDEKPGEDQLDDDTAHAAHEPVDIPIVEKSNSETDSDGFYKIRVQSTVSQPTPQSTQIEDNAEDIVIALGAEEEEDNHEEN